MCRRRSDDDADDDGDDKKSLLLLLLLRHHFFLYDVNDDVTNDTQKKEGWQWRLLCLGVGVISLFQEEEEESLCK